MPKPFLKLHRRMEDMDISQELVCVRFGFQNTSSLRRRLNGRRPWKPNEIIELGHMLEIPACELADYFFPDYEKGCVTT